MRSRCRDVGAVHFDSRVHTRRGLPGRLEGVAARPRRFCLRNLLAVQINHAFAGVPIQSGGHGLVKTDRGDGAAGITEGRE